MSLAHRVRGCWQALCVHVWITGTLGSWQVWNATLLSGSVTHTIPHYPDLTGQPAWPRKSVYTTHTHTQWITWPGRGRWGVLVIQRRHIWKETSWMTPAASYKTELYSFVCLRIVKTFTSCSYKEPQDRTLRKDDTFSSNFHYSVFTVTLPTKRHHNH